VFAILDKLIINPASLTLLTVGLVAISAAMLILSFAVRNLSGLDLGELAIGLVGITGMILALSLATRTLSTESGSMIGIGLGLIAIGIGLNVVALAVKQMAKLSWGEMVQGLVGITLALGGIGGALHAFPDNMIRTSIGLFAVGLALVVISGSMHLMAALSWEEMARGLVGIAGALTILGIAANKMTEAVPGAFAIIIMSGALVVLAFALKQFGSMEWDELIRGFVGMAGALLLFG